MATITVSIRQGRAEDEPFIAKCWLETLRSSHESRAVDSTTFSRHHLSTISRVLKRNAIDIRVANPTDDDFTIYGFTVLEAPKKIHFTYVRKPMRQMGIAAKLLNGIDATSCSFSTWSPDVQHWIFEKYRGIKYVPVWAEVSNGGTSEAAAARAS